VKQTIDNLWQRVIQAFQAGNWQQAERLCRQLLFAAPDHADAHQLLGLVYSQQGDAERAVYHLQRAITLDGRNHTYHNNLGELYRRQNQLPAAEQSFRQALALNPAFAEGHYNLANVYKQQGRLDEAIAHYREAVRHKPDYAGAWYNLGNALAAIGRFRSAIDCYQAAVSLRPAFAPAYSNLGIAHLELGELNKAIRHFREAVERQPDMTEAHRNLGLALEKEGDLAGAKAAYERVLALEPADTLFRLYVDSLFPMIAADGQQIETYHQQLPALIARYQGLTFADDQLERANASPPSITVYHGRDERPLKEAWATLFQPHFAAIQDLPSFRKPGRSATAKPHIGFVVTHGHEGVFLKCMRGLINNLSGDQFRLTILCSRQAGVDILQPAITNPAVTYLALPPQPAAAAALVRQAQIDILHYWEVGTDAMNYFLPFYRPAAVQCATWGWPATTGIPTMDYFLSSEWLETTESDAHYTEKLVRFQHLPTYYYRPPVPTTLRPRSSLGLGQRDHLYLCQQNLRKLHPDFDPILGEILRGDPQARLLFIQDAQPGVTDLLRKRLQQTIPDVAGRITFLGRLPEVDYLNLVALADVILDTIHYGGGANTIYDALAAGTPVVTLPGRFHRGRWGYAAYARIGVMDCVVDSPEAYVALALRLGSDPNYRTTISDKIRQQANVLFEDHQAVEELAAFFLTKTER
jgi:protein O-GlcNAc transferase